MRLLTLFENSEILLLVVKTAKNESIVVCLMIFDANQKAPAIAEAPYKQFHRCHALRLTNGGQAHHDINAQWYILSHFACGGYFLLEESGQPPIIDCLIDLCCQDLRPDSDKLLAGGVAVSHTNRSGTVAEWSPARDAGQA